jgi:hypothetical protein
MTLTYQQEFVVESLDEQSSQCGSPGRARERLGLLDQPSWP